MSCRTALECLGVRMKGYRARDLVVAMVEMHLVLLALDGVVPTLNSVCFPPWMLSLASTRAANDEVVCAL